jgi:hypothetical protein
MSKSQCQIEGVEGGGMFDVQREYVSRDFLHPESDILKTPSTLPPSTLLPPLRGKGETSFVMQSVINLMARGLHNRPFSGVFLEVFRTFELLNF